MIHNFESASLVLVVESIVFLYIAWQLRSFLLEPLFLPRKEYKIRIGLSLSVGFALLLYFTIGQEQGYFILSLLIAFSLISALWHPSLAFTHLIFYLLLRPWELLPSQVQFAVLPKVLVLLFLLSWGQELLLKKRALFNRDPYFFYMLVFGVLVFISHQLGGSNEDTAFKEIFVRSLAIFIFGFFAFEGVKPEYERLVGMLVIVGGGLAVYALIYTDLIQAPRLVSRGAIENSNDLAAFLILVLPLTLKLKEILKLNSLRWLPSLALLVLLVTALIGAQSRASIIALAVMVLLVFYQKFAKKIKYLAVIYFMIGLLVMGGLSQLSLGRSSEDLQASSQNRLGYWQVGLTMMARYPLFGVGFNQYPQKFTQFGVDQFTEGLNRTAHSSWILIGAEVGVMGLLLYLAIFFEGLKRAWSIWSQAPELLLSLMGYMVMMTFLSHSYLVWPYLLLGLIFMFVRQKKAVLAYE